MKDKIGMQVYPRTVYTDIVNMPDPMLLGLTIHYYNFSDEALYMKVFGSGPSPWSSNAVQLGLLNSGANAFINIDNFTSRSKPSNATTEVLTVTLEAYSDSGYSDLIHTFSRSLTVVFIKSNDGTWTTDFLDNFDNGSVNNWSYRYLEGNYESGIITSFDVTSDYVLSTPYSLKAVYRARYCYTAGGCWCRGKYQEFLFNANVLIHIGKLDDTQNTTYIPKAKWMRFVIPLQPNITSEVNIRFDLHGYDPSYANYQYIWELYKSFTTPDKTTIYAIINVRLDWIADYSSGWGYIYAWLDDFKIISK